MVFPPISHDSAGQAGWARESTRMKCRLFQPAGYPRNWPKPTPFHLRFMAAKIMGCFSPFPGGWRQKSRAFFAARVLRALGKSCADRVCASSELTEELRWFVRAAGTPSRDADQWLQKIS